MLDLVSIEDRADNARSAPVQWRFLELRFTSGLNPLMSVLASTANRLKVAPFEDAAFRPMKGQQSGVGEDSLGRLVGSQIISNCCGNTLENNSGQGRSEVFYSRASSVVSEGVDVQLTLPGSAAVFIVTDDGPAQI